MRWLELFFRKKENPVELYRSNLEKIIDLILDILSGISDPVLVVKSDNKVAYANDAAIEMLGVDPRGKSIIHSLRQPEFSQGLERVFATSKKWSGEISISRGEYSLRTTATIRKSQSGNYVVIVLKDETAAHKVEEMRGAFVANVSHELRSPLSALLGFIETMQGPARNDPSARERFLAIMLQEAHRMTRLIDDLLSLSRVEVNEHVTPEGHVDMAMLIKGIAELFSSKAKSKSISFKIVCDDNLPKVLGDMDQITQIFQNLIDNALKYGATGSEVTVTCSRIEEMAKLRCPGVMVAVSDQGEGIDKEHLPRLTERFYRVDKARSRSMGGTGLGLAIVKHIVNRHRGTLRIDSEKGKGSVFSVILPGTDRVEVQ